MSQTPPEALRKMGVEFDSAAGLIAQVLQSLELSRIERLDHLRDMIKRNQAHLARVELVLRHSTEKATNRSEGLALLLRWTELLSKPGAQEDYRRFLADRRIGERLRPCPGCTACLVCIACENDTCKRRHLLNQHCDGSGVLPARKSS